MLWASESVRLVGHDWGAVIGWHFCFAHPEMVDRYVALSVGHPTAYATAPLKQKLMGTYILVFQLRGIAEWLSVATNWQALRVGMRSRTRRPTGSRIEAARTVDRGTPLLPRQYRHDRGADASALSRR